jgi:hypothetical protein
VLLIVNRKDDRHGCEWVKLQSFVVEPLTVACEYYTLSHTEATIFDLWLDLLTDWWFFWLDSRTKWLVNLLEVKRSAFNSQPEGRSSWLWMGKTLKLCSRTVNRGLALYSVTYKSHNFLLDLLIDWWFFWLDSRTKWLVNWFTWTCKKWPRACNVLYVLIYYCHGWLLSSW